MSELRLDADTERVATNVLRFLEWGDATFSLIFLFADIEPARALAAWLDERFSLNRTELQRASPPRSFSSDPEAFVDTMMTFIEGWNNWDGAVWLELHRNPVEPNANDARLRFLARLNERRYLIERDLKRPLVLVLPVGFRVQARTVAPDLWHVRALSEVLAANPAHAMIDVSIKETAPALDKSDAAVSTPASDEPAAVMDWHRLRGSPSTAINLSVGWAAVRAFQVCGRLDAAATAAREVLVAARERVGLSERPEALRDLAISLDSVGDVASADGDWLQAEAAYREGLLLRRSLVERLGGTPESLRDLSVSLDNVGRVASAQGDWAYAEPAYRESLELRRRLAERVVGTLEAARDLSGSPDYGQMASVHGGLVHAVAAYRESLKLRRGLVEQLGGTSEALRDLSISLDNVGQVASAQGDWSQAEAVYRESLALRRQLVERLGGTPDTLDDLAVSLLNFAKVPPGNAAMLAEATQIYETLAHRFPTVERYTKQLDSLRTDNPNPTAIESATTS